MPGNEQVALATAQRQPIYICAVRQQAVHVHPHRRLPPAGKSPYDEGNGPVIMVAKLSVLSDVGEGISVPPIASQASTAPPCRTRMATEAACWRAWPAAEP